MSYLEITSSFRRLGVMNSLAERILWVLEEEELYPSARQWALATNGDVHPNTLNDLKLGKVTNPEHKTLVALADAAGATLAARAAKGEGENKRLRVAWLQHGEGAAYEFLDTDPPDQYPSRVPVIAGLRAGAIATSIIDRLRAENRWDTDPGIQVFMRLACDFIDEAEREKRRARTSGE